VEDEPPAEPDEPGGALEDRLGHRFRERSLLERALTHASAKEGGDSNERLEFLGDAVIGLVVAEFLFAAYAELEEGPLTRVRSAVVSAPVLADLARTLGLDAEVRLGKGLERRDLSAAVLANVVEAVVGAVYLDGGLDAARRLVLWGLADAIEGELTARDQRNWKSILQELTQERLREVPGYEVVATRGPDHKKEFEVVARIAGEERGRGAGPSKKAAEQAAAEAAYRALAGEPVAVQPPGRSD
jgi:ribonuclease-3